MSHLKKALVLKTRQPAQVEPLKGAIYRFEIVTIGSTRLIARQFSPLIIKVVETERSNLEKAVWHHKREDYHNVMSTYRVLH